MHRIFAAVAVFLLALPAWAEDDWALEVYLGGSEQGTLEWGGTSYSMHDGGVGGIALQRGAFSENLEFGLEMSFARNEREGAPGEDQTGTSLMATARYGLGDVGPLETYAGVGLGVVRVGLDAPGTSESADTAGGQIAVGARYSIPASTYQGFVELRHLDTFEDAELPSGNDAEYSRTDVIFGLRLGF